jgi:hypothetical protein
MDMLKIAQFNDYGPTAPGWCVECVILCAAWTSKLTYKSPLRLQQSPGCTQRTGFLSAHHPSPVPVCCYWTGVCSGRNSGSPLAMVLTNICVGKATDSLSEARNGANRRSGNYALRSTKLGVLERLENRHHRWTAAKGHRTASPSIHIRSVSLICSCSWNSMLFQ